MCVVVRVCGCACVVVPVWFCPCGGCDRALTLMRVNQMPRTSVMHVHQMKLQVLLSVPIEAAQTRLRQTETETQRHGDVERQRHVYTRTHSFDVFALERVT